MTKNGQKQYLYSVTYASSRTIRLLQEWPWDGSLYNTIYLGSQGVSGGLVAFLHWANTANRDLVVILLHSAWPRCADLINDLSACVWRSLWVDLHEWQKKGRWNWFKPKTIIVWSTRNENLLPYFLFLLLLIILLRLLRAAVSCSALEYLDMYVAVNVQLSGISDIDMVDIE